MFQPFSGVIIRYYKEIKLYYYSNLFFDSYLLLIHICHLITICFFDSYLFF
jgi:hypothetical protein